MMNVWREQDKKSISKNLKLNDNGSYFFDLNKNKKIKNFLKNRSGWVTFKSDNLSFKVIIWSLLNKKM